MSPFPRPFRHLCPNADYLDSLTDADFWAHVANSLLGNDMVPDHGDDYEDPPSNYRADTDIRGNGIAVISDHVSPCPLCQEWGACGYDEEGRPMIHALYDEGDE